MTVKILSEEEFQAKLKSLRRNLERGKGGKGHCNKTNYLIGCVTYPEGPAYTPEQLERIFNLAKN